MYNENHAIVAWFSKGLPMKETCLPLEGKVSTKLTDEVENKEKREMIKRIVNIKCEKKQHLIRVASPPTFPSRGRQVGNPFTGSR